MAFNEEDIQHLPKDSKLKQIKEKMPGSQNAIELDDGDELPVKSSGHRLRKKVFQEDNTNMSASGDDVQPDGPGKLQRKRRKNNNVHQARSVPE